MEEINLPFELDCLKKRLDALERKEGCPPHNMIDYHYAGSWAGSVPPPNKKCTKCLMETYF